MIKPKFPSREERTRINKKYVIMSDSDKHIYNNVGPLARFMHKYDQPGDEDDDLFEKHVNKQRIVEIGSGSLIGAIAAVEYGAKSVLAIDYQYRHPTLSKIIKMVTRKIDTNYYQLLSPSDAPHAKNPEKIFLVAESLSRSLDIIEEFSPTLAMFMWPSPHAEHLLEMAKDMNDREKYHQLEESNAAGEVLDMVSKVIYYGKNSDGIVAGAPDFFEELLYRKVLHPYGLPKGMGAELYVYGENIGRPGRQRLTYQEFVVLYDLGMYKSKDLTNAYEKYLIYIKKAKGKMSFYKVKSMLERDGFDAFKRYDVAARKAGIFFFHDYIKDNP